MRRAAIPPGALNRAAWARRVIRTDDAATCDADRPPRRSPDSPIAARRPGTTDDALQRRLAGHLRRRHRRSRQVYAAQTENIAVESW